MNTKILEQLNEEQKKAAQPRSGIFLVRAGAGSGKTRVITTRIAHLCLEHKVAPKNITALTFTNKAANEMKERIIELLSQEEGLPFLGTFHSFCVRLLKRYRTAIGVADFSILDSSDQEKIVRNLLAKSALHKQVTHQNVLYTISQAKNKAIDGIVNPYNIEHPLIRELFLSYEQEKAKARCFDFDDLLLETIKLLKKNTEIRTIVQESMKHVLVDEYQDTNHVQDALLRLLTTNTEGKYIAESLCVVGDEDQSIYAWRGAVISNILNFPKNFPETTEITLAQNYRSVQPILTLANKLIQNNYDRKEKNLWSTKKASNRVKIIQAGSDRQESAIITQALKLAMNKDLDCAVLYRSHHQSRIIEESLLYHSMPYQIIGGIQFYEREEIKDLLAYLRLAANPFDRIAAKRILNVPQRSLGPKVEEALLATWDNQPLLDFFQIIQELKESLPPLKKNNIGTLLSVLRSITPEQRPSVALEHIIKNVDYLAYLKAHHDEEKAREKIENVKELLTTAYAAEEREINTVALFLEEIGLLQEFSKKNQDTDQKQVTLMTLHAAKGLEFDFIALPGLEDGLFPSSRSLQNPDAIEEERRLLYVGITRAREYLLITHSDQRALFGYITSQAPSRFLAEIDYQSPGIFEKTAYWSHLQTQQLLANWFNNRQQAHTEKTNEFAKILKKTCSNNPFEKNTTKSRAWKRLQPVQHKTFGTGIIRHIEEQSSGRTILTISFSQGEKKIDATFVTAT